MKFPTAFKILNKRAKWYGMSTEELVHWLDNRVSDHDWIDESQRVVLAYEAYKKEKGYVWSGMNFQTWVKESV